MKTWNLAYPRLGPQREWKKSVDKFLSGEFAPEALKKRALEQCAERWARQHQLGLDSIPANDFSFYDHVLDHALLFGVWPRRFQVLKQEPLKLYFGMATGVDGIAPLETAQWFNTQYHYKVPEADAESARELNWSMIRPILDHLRSFPYRSHVTLLGPFTFSKLIRLSGVTYSELIERLVPLYRAVLAEMKRYRFDWVQLHEPILSGDCVREDLRIVKKIYDALEGAGPNILVAAYYESPDPWMSELVGLHVQGFHFDLVAGARSLSYLKTRAFPKDRYLSLGLVDGRNVWAASLTALRKEVTSLSALYDPEKLWLAPSCPLIHLPYDVSAETDLPDALKNVLSFADQRLEELLWLKRSFLGDRSYEKVFAERDVNLAKWAQLPEVHRGDVRQAVERIDESMRRRSTLVAKRAKLQSLALGIPVLPITTVGSLPQSEKIKKIRQRFLNREMEKAEYETNVEKEVAKAIAVQERAGVDVLVHGEVERGDRVEYFSDGLEGIMPTKEGWIQTLGNQCVRPPLLYGDVKRGESLTVRWYQYAQSLTKKPVKGMVTGPVTLLNSCFVRSDMPRERLVYQLSLAIRDEVLDLERAGAKIIQVDEPALREGLPLKRAHWNQYLKWAIDAFKIATSAVKDQTQIQTHMSYRDFGDIMESVVKMDVDVLLIEDARKGDLLQDSFKTHRYPNAIGPGVYDTQSANIPSVDILLKRLKHMMAVIGLERLWVAPDSDFKTGTYDQTEAMLRNLSSAVQEVRSQIHLLAPKVSSK